MRKLIVASLAILATALPACGTRQSTRGPGPTSTPARSSSVRTEQITALAEQVFPKVAQYGYYGVCGLDGNVSACPHTDADRPNPRRSPGLHGRRQTLLNGSA
jgi:hypothetical protein